MSNTTDDGESETETLEQAQVNLDLSCYRNPPPLPGGGNIEGFIIDCINAGGEGVCMNGQPTCCRTRGGVRQCTTDPSTFSRLYDSGTPPKPEVAPINEPTLGFSLSIQ